MGRKWEFTQKAAPHSGRLKKTTPCKDLAHKNLQGWLRLHDDLVHKQRSASYDGLRVSPTFWSCGHSSQHSIRNGYTCPLWLRIDTVFAHQSPALTVRDFYGRYTGKSPATKTVVLKILHLLPRLMSSLLLTHMWFDYVHKCLWAHCLLTIRTYSFSGQFMERGSNYYNSNLSLQPGMGDKQLPVMYQFRDWTVLYFVLVYFLNFIVLWQWSCQCLQICCALSRGGGAFSWSCK